MQKWAQKQTGFTIVELLIVVVVIAILAAVTVMGYSGIQQRAKNAAIVSVVDSWEKTLRLAATDGASLPPLGACLGRSGDYPAKDGFGVNECVTIDGTSPAGVVYSDGHYSTWTNTQRPSALMPIVSYTTSGSVLRARGVWVGVVNTSSNPKTIEMRWLSQVDGSCARGSAFVAPIAGSITGGYCGLVVSY